MNTTENKFSHFIKSLSNQYVVYIVVEGKTDMMVIRELLGFVEFEHKRNYNQDIYCIHSNDYSIVIADVHGRDKVRRCKKLPQNVYTSMEYFFKRSGKEGIILILVADCDKDSPEKLEVSVKNSYQKCFSELNTDDHPVRGVYLVTVADENDSISKTQSIESLIIGFELQSDQNVLNLAKRMQPLLEEYNLSPTSKLLCFLKMIFLRKAITPQKVIRELESEIHKEEFIKYIDPILAKNTRKII